MAQYFDDFRDATVGAAHPDFAALWLSINQTVTPGNPLAESGNSVSFDYADTGTFSRSSAKWKDILAGGKTTVRALVSYQNHTGLETGDIIGPFLSGTGTEATRDGYVVWAGKDFRLSRYENGGDSAVGSATGPSSGTRITENLEILRDGSLVEVRKWANGSARPSTAFISYTDPSPLPVSGHVGLSLLLIGGVAGTVDLHSIAVGTNGDPAPTGPVTGGTDNLTANDISSTSQVSSPAIGQTHSLNATDVQSTSEVSSPALATQSNTNNLSADDISSTSSVSAPVLGQVHSLAANDAAANTETGTPTLQQTHALTSVDIQSLSTVSSPALTSVAGQDSLAANDVEATSTVSSPAIGQVHNLTASNLDANSETSQTAIAQVHAITANDLASATQVSTPTIRNASQVLVTPIKNTRATVSHVVYRATVSQTTYKAAIIQPVYKAGAG